MSLAVTVSALTTSTSTVDGRLMKVVVITNRYELRVVWRQASKVVYPYAPQVSGNGTRALAGSCLASVVQDGEEN